MKIGTIVMMVLAVGLVFAIFGSIVNDFEIYYDVEVNETLGGNYDYSERINASVSGLASDFKTLSDEETGWLTWVGAGFMAVPHAIIAVVGTLLISIGFGISIFSDVASKVKIPIEIISIGLVALIIVVVFSLVSFWRRYKSIP